MPSAKETIVELQNKDLLAQTYHIDGRVTAIEGRMNQFGDQLNRIEQSLLNKPPLWNIGNIMGLMGMIAGLMWGIYNFVSLEVDQLRETTDRNTAVLDKQWQRLNELQPFQKEMHYEVGTLRKSIEILTRDAEHADMLYHQLDDRVREAEKKGAAAEVSRKAIGDFVKEVDQHGSRYWNGVAKEKLTQ